MLALKPEPMVWAVVEVLESELVSLAEEEGLGAHMLALVPKPEPNLALRTSLLDPELRARGSGCKSDLPCFSGEPIEALLAALPRRCTASLSGLLPLSEAGASGTDDFKGVRPRPRPLVRAASPSCCGGKWRGWSG